MAAHLRIIVGPTDMRVESHGFSSRVVALSAQDDTPEIHGYARDLWAEIRHFVSWAVWLRHRLTMAALRRMVTFVQDNLPGPYYPGPRPDLIAVKPWKQAAYGEWTSLPHGVVARLLRSSK